MAPNVALPYLPQNRAHVASVDVRLASRWGCQVGTAKARRERSLKDSLDVLEEYVLAADPANLEHFVSLYDAVLSHRVKPAGNPLYVAGKADTSEDALEVEYRQAPSKETARAWLDALGREGRCNEPAMALLRQEWGL